MINDFFKCIQLCCILKASPQCSTPSRARTRLLHLLFVNIFSACLFGSLYIMICCCNLDAVTSFEIITSMFYSYFSVYFLNLSLWTVYNNIFCSRKFGQDNWYFFNSFFWLYSSYFLQQYYTPSQARARLLFLTFIKMFEKKTFILIWNTGVYETIFDIFQNSYHTKLAILLPYAS